MKQSSDIGAFGGTGESDPRSRRLRLLRWAFIVMAIIGIGFLSHLSGWVTTGFGVLIVILGLFLLTLLWTKWSDRRRQRRWRRDGILFEPELPRPISSIPEELEWRLPSHPLIRGPLAVVLITLLYWVLIVHGMQLPGGWLVGTVVLALINLWVWPEPLLVVFIVAIGVALLALLGWIVKTVPLAGIIVLVLSLTAAVIALLMQIRKRQSKSHLNE